MLLLDLINEACERLLHSLHSFHLVVLFRLSLPLAHGRVFLVEESDLAVSGLGCGLFQHCGSLLNSLQGCQQAVCRGGGIHFESGRGGGLSGQYKERPGRSGGTLASEEQAAGGETQHWCFDLIVC